MRKGLVSLLRSAALAFAGGCANTYTTNLTDTRPTHLSNDQISSHQAAQNLGTGEYVFNNSIILGVEDKLLFEGNEITPGQYFLNTAVKLNKGTIDINEDGRHIDYTEDGKVRFFKLDDSLKGLRTNIRYEPQHMDAGKRHQILELPKFDTPSITIKVQRYDADKRLIVEEERKFNYAVLDLGTPEKHDEKAVIITAAKVRLNQEAGVVEYYGGSYFVEQTGATIQRGPRAKYLIPKQKEPVKTPEVQKIEATPIK